MPAFNPKLAFVQSLRPAELAAHAADERQFPFARELHLVRTELAARGVDVRSIGTGEALPDLSGLSPTEIFAFADCNTTGQWIRAFGLEPHVACSYPSALWGTLHRQHWEGVPETLAGGPAASIRPVFVKPARPCLWDGRKVQSGIHDSLDVLESAPVGLRESIYACSEVVDWMSEYRCYVCNAEIVGIHPYSLRLPPGWSAEQLEEALPSVRPTEDFVQTLIAQLDAAGQLVSGFCLDVGLIAYGSMALIEMNDGLALTNYGISSADYLDLHLARWHELMCLSARLDPTTPAINRLAG